MLPCFLAIPQAIPQAYSEKKPVRVLSDIIFSNSLKSLIKTIGIQFYTSQGPLQPILKKGAIGLHFAYLKLSKPCNKSKVPWDNTDHATLGN